MSRFVQEGAPLWEPPPETVAEAEITAYMQWLGAARGMRLGSYAALWEWSANEIEAFWASIWDYFEVIADAPYGEVLPARKMPGADWFPGTSLNYAENVMRGRDGPETAILHLSESRPLTALSWAELGEQVAAAASALRRLGVEPGDRVVAYIPNIVEAVIAFLASSSIGAVWSSCSPDFGERSVVDRFAQVEPKVLIAVDGYSYGGREFERLDVVSGLQGAIPSIEHTVIIPFLAEERDTGELRNVIRWDRLMATGEGAGPEFARLPFDHPLWVLYSSGTTGLPKPIVHSQGGMLLEQLKTAHLHLDLKEGDRFTWFTTTGWMMWNFLVSGLLTKAAIVLYDGSPGYPDLTRMWQLCADAEVTFFGTSAAFISACMKEGVEPRRGRDLSQLRAVGSTGSPLVPEAFEWIYEEVGSGTWLTSISGGTDVCTAFIGGVPTLPVYRGELQARSLGANVQAFNEAGEPVIGEVGELVITEPMPSMPIFFWGDADGSRYREAYFDMFPGVWRHGDWVEITERGTAIIYGRSDSTINRGGIRMGTSEIYRAVLGVEEVVDALVVDVPREGTEGWMPLFVVLESGNELTEDLRSEIGRRIRGECSPRHVPNEVYEVDQVPRTLSGKVLEVPIKRILSGADPEATVSRDSLANPEALDWFIGLAGQLTER